MVTASLFIRVFLLIYRSFTRIYVMIFQSAIYNFSSIKKKKGLCSEDEKRIDSGQSLLCLCSISAIQKASTHSTEEHNSYYSMPSDLGLKQKK